MVKVNGEEKINYNDNLKYDLYKEFVKSLKDEDFKKLVKRVNVPEDVAMKYTSKFENTVAELKNCSKCKGLLHCKNKVNGCVYFPYKVNDTVLSFDYHACKYKKEQIEKEKNRPLVFDEPIAIKEARMGDIDLTDKKRVNIIKWAQKFYKEYQKDQHIKGIYLHGSFGAGKSYILAALINELSKNGARCVMVYFPDLLGRLKESFDDGFKEIMFNIKNADVLLLDDIGAESVTPWGRDEILGAILQYRMDAKLPTFFTSNLNIEELEVHLSQTKGSIDIVKSKRIIERIKFLTEDIELISENRRK